MTKRKTIKPVKALALYNKEGDLCFVQMQNIVGIEISANPFSIYQEFTRFNKKILKEYNCKVIPVLIIPFKKN